MPEMTGGVWSILIVTETEAESPAPFVAEQVKVAPAVSAVRVVGVHPVEDAMPDSGSVTFQLTVTLLRYHPLFPTVPVIWGLITGGVVSIGFGSTWKPLSKAAPSPPVVISTSLKPREAVVAILIVAEALVAELMVRFVTVIPELLKLSTVVPDAK